MDNNEIKRANRRALPLFILIMVVSLLAGGALGYFAAERSLNELSDVISAAGDFFGAYVAPWLMLAVAVLVPAVCVPLYRRAKKLLDGWDGEDEEVSDTFENRVSVIIWITSAAMVVSYFLITASYSRGFESVENPVTFLVGIAAFFAIMIEAVLLTQKCADAAKRTNPEKTASVYDMRFQKKWMDTCDEAEKIMIGKCAFKAYSVTNNVCVVLSVVLAVSALIFGTGFLPSLAVCLIWLVNLSVYCRECLKCSKAGNMIP